MGESFFCFFFGVGVGGGVETHREGEYVTERDGVAASMRFKSKSVHKNSRHVVWSVK